MLFTVTWTYAQNRHIVHLEEAIAFAVGEHTAHYADRDLWTQKNKNGKQLPRLPQIDGL